MNKQARFWKVIDQRRLLLVLMRELAGDAHISFEGNLHGLRLLSMPGASDEPTEALKRNTLWPKQDFIVLPLEPAMSEAIISAIGVSVPKGIIHIQIEKGGLIQFGAYDNFHPQCIFFGSAVREEVVEALISDRMIRPYTERPHR